MNKLSNRIYGGLTEKVDHEHFEPKTGSFAIKNAFVLSQDGTIFMEGQSVLIENGIINKIDSNLILSPEVNIIDGSGKYLIPGLIDAHVHLFKSSNDLLLYLANGVTEIRELIGEKNHLKWRREIENGRIGPKMYVASPRLGSFGFFEGLFMTSTQGFMNIRNAEEANKKVQKLYDEGYDCIKIYSHLNKESYLAITKKAKELGMSVTGHIPWSVSFEDIWENGQSDIAHFEEILNTLNREFGYYNGENATEFLEFVSNRCDEIAKILIKENITVTSTMWGTENIVNHKFDLNLVLNKVELDYVNPGMSEWSSIIPAGPGWLPGVNMQRLPNNLNPGETEGRKSHWETYIKAEHLIAQKLIQHGVKILAGTDASIPPMVPGFSLHDEFISLNKSGMTTTQVLQSATVVPAQWLKSNSGKIAIGFEANLVLLDKNPLVDISNTKEINTVISKGEVFDRILLNEILAAVKEANDKSRTVDVTMYSDVN